MKTLHVSTETALPSFGSSAQPRRHAEQLPLPFLFQSLDVLVVEPEDVKKAPEAFSPANDIRSELARALHDLNEYRLPATSRAGMIVELMARPLLKSGPQFYPSWDIRMDFSWNQTGRVAGGKETTPEHDEKWQELLGADSSIFHEACTRALSVWVDDYVDLLDMDGAFECSIDLAEPARDALVLKSFAGHDMGFASRSDWADHLKSLDDAALCDLWTALRVLDADLSRKERAQIMAHMYNEIRSEREVAWDLEVEDLSF